MACTMTSQDLVFRNLAPCIGDLLSVKDRNNMVLAHRCMGTAHANKIYHAWSFENWRGGDCENSGAPEVWERKWRSLIKRKPRVSRMQLKLANCWYQDWGHMDAARMAALLRAVPDQIKHMHLVIPAKEDYLEAFMQATSDFARPSCDAEYTVVLIATGFCPENLERFFEHLVNHAMGCHVHLYAIAGSQSYLTAVANAPAGAVLQLHCQTTVQATSYTVSAPMDKLAQIPLLAVDNYRCVPMSSDALPILSLAHHLEDHFTYDTSTTTLAHVDSITKACTRLHMYVLRHVSAELAQSTLIKSLMDRFEASSVNEIYFSHEAVESPWIVYLLRRMLAARKRASLHIGLIDTGTPLISACVELIQRYVPGLRVPSPTQPMYSSMPYAALMHAIQGMSPEVAGAWQMLRPPLH